MNSLKKLKEYFLAQGGESAMLDELVHETASIHASNINNCGVEDQLEYLVENGIPVESILGVLSG